MRLINAAAWFRALRDLRNRRVVAPDAGDMGTAFGLDSITVVPPSADEEDGRSGRGAPAARDWNRRLARRSRL